MTISSSFWMNLSFFWKFIDILDTNLINCFYVSYAKLVSPLIERNLKNFWSSLTDPFFKQKICRARVFFIKTNHENLCSTHYLHTIYTTSKYIQAPSLRRLEFNIRESQKHDTWHSFRDFCMENLQPQGVLMFFIFMAFYSYILGNDMVLYIVKITCFICFTVS